MALVDEGEDLKISMPYMIFLFAAARYFCASSGLSEAYWSHAG